MLAFETMDQKGCEINIKECRICQQSNNEKSLISPCDCRGSIKYVHIKCLKVWMQTTKEEFCGLCRTRYDIYHFKKGKSFWKYLITNESNRICFLLTLLFSAFCIFMPIVSFKYIQSQRHQYCGQTILYQTIIGSLILMNSCAFALLIQSWICLLNSFKEWQFTHYDFIFPNNS